MSHSPILDRRPALEAFRFYEQIGVPTRMTPVTVTAAAYAGIAKWLLDVDVDRAMVALTRTAGLPEKEGISASFSRDTVSALDEEVAKRWAERLLMGVKALIVRLGNPAMAGSAEGRLKVLLEMLSRITLRLQEFAGPALDLGLELHAQRGYRHTLEKPLQRLFKRAFGALPDSQVGIYRIRLFETRIPITTNAYYTDPAAAAVDRQGLKSGDEAFDDIIVKTIAAVRDQDARYGAVMRLHWLERAEVLSASQVAAFAAALWDDRFIKDGLPAGTPLRPWVFASMPHPPGSDPHVAARARILELTSLDEDDALGTLSGISASKDSSIVLNARELKPLVGMLLAKAAPEPPDASASRLPSFFTSDRLDFSFWQIFDQLFELAVRHASLKPLFTAYYAGTPRIEAARSVVTAVEAGVVTLDYAEKMLVEAWRGVDHQPLTAAFASIRWARAKPGGRALPRVVWEIAADSVVAIDEHSVLAALDFLRAAYATLVASVPRRLDGRLGRALLAILARTGRADVRAKMAVDPGAVRYAGARLVAAMDRAGRAPTGLLESWQEADRQEGVGEIRDGLRRDDLE